MKRIVYFLIGILLPLASMPGCTDFPDDFGMEASPSVELLRAIPVSESSYKAQCQFRIDGHLPHVESAYVTLEYGYEDIWSESVDPSKFANGDTFIITIPEELEFGQTYYVNLFIKRDVCIDRYSCYLNFDKSKFAPHISSMNVEMIAKNKISITAFVDKNGEFVPTGNFTWRYKQGSSSLNKLTDISTTISEAESYYVMKAEVDLDKAPLLLSSSSYFYHHYVGYNLSNVFGSTSGYYSSSSFSLYSNGSNYTGDDGTFDDYIQLCGIKWAKGNLQYDNGTWRIAPEQWSTFSYGSVPSETQIEHFALGETGVIVPGSIRYNSSNPVYKKTTNVQGTSADIVTAHLGTQWGIPSKAQFNELSYASKSYVTINGVPGYLYWTPSTTKRYYISGLSVSPSVLKDACMLFLPNRGYYDYNYLGKKYQFIDTSFEYLTSNSYGNSNNYHSIYYWRGESVDSKQEDDLIYMPIRPVKLK